MVLRPAAILSVLSRALAGAFDYAGTESMRWAGSSSRKVVGSGMVAQHLEARKSWCARECWYMRWYGRRLMYEAMQWPELAAPRDWSAL